MATSEDKQWAAKYLLDPLTAPEPSDETGPGTTFGNSLAAATPLTSIPSTPNPSSPARQASRSSTKSKTLTKKSAYPTPPSSASPRRDRFPDLSPSIGERIFPSSGDRQSRGNLPETTSEDQGHRRRGSSLTGRYPGDQSHRPLDMIRQEAKLAHRSPHLRKTHIPGTDAIDSLDDSFGGVRYHHEGPFDATLFARNTSFESSPLEAVRSSNMEAIKATPRERIQDSLEKHRPLDGTSSVPSGMTDYYGRRMEYEEGADLMIEDGYRRWPGLQYLPEDLKGKGEPSYSLEKALKDHKAHTRSTSDCTGTYEMASNIDRPRSSVDTNTGGRGSAMRSYADWEGDIRRTSSTGKNSGFGLKKRFGSLRRKDRASS
ncbi:MAG: hypothetical protein M1824_005918 [Vezdaea acicularis]|nr:MAG: hypothetical protein M1824_005918 [Vezdaea acicularis]